ncbi:hypothetical protein C0J52_23255 [Blattella germanica]|nr:hypothetical protein C0J52_23255 [Blattella germanica]
MLQYLGFIYFQKYLILVHFFCTSHNVILPPAYFIIHSHLSYGILLWGNHSYFSIFFVLQKRAVRIIVGVPGRCLCKPLFIKHGILTLPSMNNLYPNKAKYEVIKNRFDTVSINLFNSIPTSVKDLPEKNSSHFLDLH